MDLLKSALKWLWEALKGLVRGIWWVLWTVIKWIVNLPLRLWRYLQPKSWVTRALVLLLLVGFVWIAAIAISIPVPSYLLDQPAERVAYAPVSKLMHLAARPPSKVNVEALKEICEVANKCEDAQSECSENNGISGERTCRELRRTCSESRRACSAGAEKTFQGWTERDRNTYYYTSQGAAQVMFGSMRYDWFAELETPFSKDKFASPENLGSFGFLVSPGQKADPFWNPGNMPVGFTRYYDQEVKAEVLDVTCALCHSGELHYTDPVDETIVTALRIDGGQAMHAVTSLQMDQFQAQMMQSLVVTWLNPWKFDRFARNVFNRRLDSSDAASEIAFKERKAQLHDAFGEMIGKLSKQAWFELSNGIYPTLEGYGRIDAVQRIANTVFGRSIDEANYKPGVAPVSYPHTWDIGKFDWVQYEGYASQPMARNINEALGVGARLDLFDDVGLPLPKHERFRTSVDPKRLHEIESTLSKLTAPKWPESLWGKPNKEEASRGRALFDVHCRACHGPHRGPAFPTASKEPNDKIAEPHVRAELKYLKDEEGNDYCVLGEDNERISDQACLHLQNPQRIADESGKPMFTLNEKGQVTGTCKDGEKLNEGKIDGDKKNIDKQCGGSPESVEEWRILTLPLVAIGTDPTAANNLADQRYDASRLALSAEDLRAACVSDTLIENLDPKSVNAIVGLNMLSLSIANRYFEDNPPKNNQEMLRLMGYGILDYPISDTHHLKGYKTRPLHGIWATPPFLHNGSVRTIYQLLSPVEERESEFWVGTKEYDPERLGYKNSRLEGAILQKASDLGNSNSGHEFRTGCEKYGVIGPYLPPKDRWAIMEYLKVMDYVEDDELEDVLDASVVAQTTAELNERYPHYGTDKFYEGWQGHCSFEDPVYAAANLPQLTQDVIYEDRHKAPDCSLYKLYRNPEESFNE